MVKSACIWVILLQKVERLSEGRSWNEQVLVLREGRSMLVSMVADFSGSKAEGGLSDGVEGRRSRCNDKGCIAIIIALLLNYTQNRKTSKSAISPCNDLSYYCPFVADSILYKTMASSQYSIVKHTILPLIFKIAHKNTLTYLIKDPATNSLVLLPSPQDTKTLKEHVSKIQHQFQCRLTHTFVDKRAEMGQLFDERIVSAEECGELKPELIGELSICFIKAAGYRRDYHLLAATHITPTSTKFPVLFTGSALSVCSIDLESQAKPQEYMQTLNKLKYFPNQVLLFPQRKVKLDDLQFCYALDKNAFLARKIEQFKQKSQEMEDCLIPSSILQEKTMNPFLSPQKYSSLLQSTDQNASFQLLRKMRRQWRQ